MSALAYILAKRQLPVSGSDLRPSHITQRLHAVGAHIFNHQTAENLEFFQPQETACEPLSAAARGQAVAPTLKSIPSEGNSQVVKWQGQLPQVICSTAISASNSEYQAAIAKGCQIFHRSDLLAALMKDYQSVAVAGTHGKTTTSSLIGYLLLQAGLDPTIVVGGEVEAWDGNARLGQGNYLVAEADESDGTLAKLHPAIGVVTNIELDHPDHYQSLEAVIGTFTTFAAQCKTLIGCWDCETVRSRLHPDISYSLSPDSGADYRVQGVTYHAQGTTAEVWEQGQRLGQLKLQLLGKHNLQNALAAVAVGRKLGLEFAVIAEAIASFTGTKRRFEERGKVNGITLIDDYAHHPSEIRATLSAAHLRKATGSVKRIVAIFQPHRYSRTETFLTDFACAFQDADLVTITDIYSAGEPGRAISGQQVTDAIAAHHPQVIYHPDLNSLPHQLSEWLQPGDLVLFLGAGNLNQTIPEVIAHLSKLATT